MFQSLLAFFAFGAVGFWILCFILSIIIVAGIENEKAFIPTLLLITLGFVYWGQLTALEISFKQICLSGLVYVAAGVGWSFYRWNKHVSEVIDEWQKKGWTRTQVQKEYYEVHKINVTQHKSRIIAWISYWPWSLVWNISDDFFRSIYDNLTKVYQRIADRHLNKLPN